MFWTFFALIAHAPENPEVVDFVNFVLTRKGVRFTRKAYYIIHFSRHAVQYSISQEKKLAQ
jgi:hypothetical protein